MKKILLISYYWPPSGGPGVQRWLKFVKYLVKFGHEVTVITVDPNKAAYPIKDHSLMNELPDGLRVVRTSTFEPYGVYTKMTGKKEIPYSGFANEQKAGIVQKISRFVRGNFFIPDARKGWNKFALSKAKELMNEESYDHVITTGPPHSTHLIGLELKKYFNVNWVCDMRDPWTGIYYYKEMMHLPFAVKKDKQMEKSVLESADVVITVSDALKRGFEKLATTLKPVVVIPNGFDAEDFDLSNRQKSDKFVLSYIGTLSQHYPIKGFVDVISKLSSELISNLRISLTGKGLEDLHQRLAEVHGLEVEHEGHVNHNKAVSKMIQSDLLLMIIPDVPDNDGILTGKLFEYLATGNKILCLGPESSDVKAILESCSAGKVFEYHDNSGITGFIESTFNEFLKNEHSEGGNMEKRMKFSRENLCAKLLENI